MLGNKEKEDANGFTFPSCNPVKRIDFILVRNATAVSDKDVTAVSRKDVTDEILKMKKYLTWKVNVLETRIVGIKPTPDTTHRVEVLFRVTNNTFFLIYIFCLFVCLFV